MRPEKVLKHYTGNFDQPDSRLNRSGEKQIDISQGRKDDFRR
ncbi:MAG: hypothetical protein ACJ8F7_16195 [Gemmataceae bacterium]